MNDLRYPFTAQEIIDTCTESSEWLSRVLSWASSSGPYTFSYYACWVGELELWFLTGKGDYYGAEGGITTEQLAEILNDERPTSVWLSIDWKEVHG